MWKLVNRSERGINKRTEDAKRAFSLILEIVIFIFLFFSGAAKK